MVAWCLLFFPSGGLGRTHASPACCSTMVVVGHIFSRPTPPDLFVVCGRVGCGELVQRSGGELFFAGGLLWRFRLRARYFCRQTKVPKNWLGNLRFLRTSLGGDLLPALLPIRRFWSNTLFSRVLSHLGGSRSRFLPTGTAGPGWWGGGCGPMRTSAPTVLIPLRGARRPGARWRRDSGRGKPLPYPCDSEYGA